MVFFKRRGKPQSLVKYIEYIQATGTQYIDTGFKPNQNTRVVMKFKGEALSDIYWVFGGRNSTGNGTVGVFWYQSAWNADYAGNEQRYAYTTSISSSTLINVDYNKNVVSINNYSHTFSKTTFQSNYPLALLAVNTGGEISGKIKGKLYSCQIYDNGVLVRDYLPCKNEAGVVCLYDKLNDEYVYNAGSGSFTAGPEL